MTPNNSNKHTSSHYKLWMFLLTPPPKPHFIRNPAIKDGTVPNNYRTATL